MKPAPDVAKQLRTLSPAVVSLIKLQCEGDWRRVTLDARGVLRVHNTPQLPVLLLRVPVELAKAPVAPQAESKAGIEWHDKAPSQLVEEQRARSNEQGLAETALPRRRVARPRSPRGRPALDHLLATWEARREAERVAALEPEPAPEPAPEPEPTLEPEPVPDLCIRCASPDHLVLGCPVPYVSPAEHRRKKREQTRKSASAPRLIGSKLSTRGGVTLPETIQVQDLRDSVSVATGPSDDAMQLTGNQLVERWRTGLPAHIVPEIKPDVLALFGITEEIYEGALRHPDRVEVRPESFEPGKRYIIIGFYRGDVGVMLGTRSVSSPAIIAVYADSKLEADTHRVGYASTGGGGARGTKGLPNSPRQLMARLRGRGCQVELGVNEKAVEVFYDGKTLGKVGVAPDTSKSQIQSDYQRCIRRIEAMSRAS